VVNRISDLTGHPIPGLSSRITPLKFALFKGIAKEWWYIRQLVDVMDSTFGLPLLLVGAAGLAYVGWARRRAALCLLLPAGSYYYMSLRTHDVLTLRYTLPLVPIVAVGAGALCAAGLRRRRAAAGVVVAALCLLALARAVELNVLLRNDSRYRAERWMAGHAAPGSSVEFYQKPVRVPRWEHLQAREIPLAERSIEAVGERRPDFIVISSAGRAGITRFWNPDWHKGGLLLERPEARAFLTALEGEQLSYRRVAEFSQQPHLLRLRITSLCPTISIYQRLPSS